MGAAGGTTPEEHWCDGSVLPFFPCCLRHVFPAENGFICLLCVVLQLWYFAWRGKFKNLLNFSRHVPFWTLGALTTSSRWHDPCEWCFICCFSWMCHPGPSMLCFSLRLLNSRHVSSLSTLGLASRSVGCSLSRISVICLAALVFSFSLGFRQKVIVISRSRATGADLSWADLPYRSFSVAECCVRAPLSFFGDKSRLQSLGIHSLHPHQSGWMTLVLRGSSAEIVNFSCRSLEIQQIR